MKYIDIHCHLDFPDYESDREEVLARMKEEEVGAITIGADLESSKKAVEIAEANENVWACIGIHPETSLNVREVETNSPGELSDLVKSPKVVAIGECGLDYFGRRSLGEGGLSQEEKNKQKNLFEKQIQFAIKYDKPLMLHVRDAYEDALEILKNYEKARGNVHFFAGDITVAKQFLDLGFTTSFTGVITFTHDYDEVIKSIPRDSIMSETDAPFVAPVPKRGQRNEPAYVTYVVQKMAEIRGENEENFRIKILENARKTFGLPN